MKRTPVRGGNLRALWEITNFILNESEENVKMARTIDYKTLIDAVERYVRSESFPKVEVICAILGIAQDDEKSGDTDV